MGEGILLPEHMGKISVQLYFTRVVRDQPGEANRQQLSQGILVSTTERIGKRLKTMTAQNETVMFHFPEVFALAFVKSES